MYSCNANLRLLAVTLKRCCLARLLCSLPPGLHFLPIKTYLNAVVNGASLPMAAGDWLWDWASGVTYSFCRLSQRLVCFWSCSVGVNGGHGLHCTSYWASLLVPSLSFITILRHRMG